MEQLPSELDRRIAALAADCDSGASGILAKALDILADARAGSAPVAPVARALCRAQPSMAPVWNAALHALADGSVPGCFDRFVQRVARAPQALARFARTALVPGADAAAPDERRVGGPLFRAVTLSSSQSVRTVLDALRTVRPLQVACSESRPALEGRRLAAQLAADGIAVTCFSDAALGHALQGADAVVVGADAIAPAWFLNKSGTCMLAAAAQQAGVPVYVAATRDKFVSHALAARLSIREGRADEVWGAPPPGVEVRNPYFERTPLDLVTAIVSDAGVLGAAMVGEACETALDPAFTAALEALDATG